MIGKVQRSPPAKPSTPTPSESETDTIKQRAAPPGKGPTQNLTARQKRRRGAEEDCDCATVRDDIRQMMTDMISKQNDRLERLENHIKSLKSQGENDTKDIKSRVDQVQSTNIHIENSLDFLTHQIQLYDNKITTLDTQNKLIAKQVSQLDDKIENMERFSLKTTIEIRNVPKKPKETKDNLLQVLQTLATSLQITIQNHELRDMYRLPAKPELPTSTIVVEFSNTWSKAHLLNAIKLFKKNKSDQLNSKHLGFDGQALPIYISERLTAKAKRLHFLAREFAKSENYAHCWVTNSKIFIRKRDGAPYIIIKNEEHLHSLRSANQDMCAS